MIGWVATQHAVEQYIERVDPSVDFGRARSAIGRAAARASKLGPAPRGAERWRAGGRDDGPAFVAVVEPVSKTVVTVWKDWEANMTGMHGLTWGQLLGVELTKANKLPQDVARRGKVDVTTVQKWMADERAPSNRAASLVYQVLPAMRMYGPQLVALRKTLADRHVAEPMTPKPEPDPVAPKVERKADARPAVVAAELPLASTPGLAPVGFGATLRRGRNDRGMSQADLARALGVCNQKIVRWELDRLSPDPLALSDLRAMFPALIGVEPKAKAVSLPGPRKERARVKAAESAKRPVGRPRGASAAVKKAAAEYVAEEAREKVEAPAPEPEAPAPKADGSPIKRWLEASRAVKSSPHRAVVLDLLRLAAEAGLGLDDVVDAVS